MHGWEGVYVVGGLIYFYHMPELVTTFLCHLFKFYVVALFLSFSIRI